MSTLPPSQSWTPSYTWGSWFLQIWIYPTWESTEVFSFLADRVLRKEFFFYKFLYTCMYSYIKIQLLLWPKPTPGDHYFHKRESALLENAFTKVSAFLSDKFLRRNNDFLPLYCAWNFTSNIQILVNHSQCTFEQI